MSLTDQVPQAPGVSHAVSGKPSMVCMTVDWPYFKMSVAFIELSFPRVCSACERSRNRLQRFPIVARTTRTAIVEKYGEDKQKYVSCVELNPFRWPSWLFACAR